MSDEMKILEALLNLGMLLDSDKKPDIDKFKAQAEAKRDENRKKAHDFMLQDAERQARNAKALYDAFVKVGFTEDGAFELLKAILD